MWDPLLWKVGAGYNLESCTMGGLTPLCAQCVCVLQSRILHKGGSDPPVCAVCVCVCILTPPQIFQIFPKYLKYKKNMKMHENSMGCRFKNSYVAASKGVGHCGSLWDPLLWNVVESGCWLQSRIQHKGGSDPPVCAVLLFKNNYIAARKAVGPLVVQSGCWLQSRIQHKGGSDPPVCAVCVMDLPKSSQSILNIRKI